MGKSLTPTGGWGEPGREGEVRDRCWGTVRDALLSSNSQPALPGVLCSWGEWLLWVSPWSVHVQFPLQSEVREC